MSATNYARRTLGKREPCEVRFFGADDEIPRALLSAPWVWWAVPRDYHEVTLVGETHDQRCARMRHAPRQCVACLANRWRPS